MTIQYNEPYVFNTAFPGYIYEKIYTSDLMTLMRWIIDV